MDGFEDLDVGPNDALHKLRVSALATNKVSSYVIQHVFVLGEAKGSICVGGIVAVFELGVRNAFFQYRVQWRVL